MGTEKTAQQTEVDLSTVFNTSTGKVAAPALSALASAGASSFFVYEALKSTGESAAIEFTSAGIFAVLAGINIVKSIQAQRAERQAVARAAKTNSL